MDNILIATVDENWNQFENIGGVYRPVLVVPEFNSKIEKESVDCNFFIDYDGYASLGYRNYPLRSTRVFLKEGEEIEDEHCVTSPYGDLDDVISQNHHKTIYFKGGSDFVTDVITHITRIEICVGTHTNELTNPQKFPTEIAKVYFTGRKDREPKMLESINKLKELGGLDEDDKLFQCPSNYMFHTFTRSKNSGKGVDDSKLRYPITLFVVTHQPPQHKTKLFENETLIIFGKMEHSGKMDAYNRSMTLTSQELITRYEKGENFENDKSDVVSVREWEINDIIFRYRSLNGKMDFDNFEKLDEYIHELSNTHLIDSNLWNIKL